MKTERAHIRTFRQKTGLTQEAVAKQVGVSLTTFKRWEYGETEPTISDIKRLCEVLGVTEAELLQGPTSEDWVLEIKTGGKEVIDMNKAVGCVSSVNCGSDGAVLTLGGRYETFQDETKFEGLIAQLRAARELILQNGESLKEINEKGKEAEA